MIDFNRNNLDLSASPYLQQHKDNPIFWQEWNKDSLAYAKEHNKQIFVSIGYATCHWCHVMASEAFSNQQVADYLNEHFVSIKVDREQRPDIDQYFMQFIQRTRGQGGWPLNAWMTADQKPIVALTYVSTVPKYGMPAFIEVLKQIKEKGFATEFDPNEEPEDKPGFEIHDLERMLLSYADEEFGGFNQKQKFPPHNTLLFLLNRYSISPNDDSKRLIEQTLHAMANRGLHDHLQGGFYRYCVDKQWIIPHFEKMLYDQAMLLWVYSLAYKQFQEPMYKVVAERIIKSLEETFRSGDLYISAHDADTAHVEGDTYVWEHEELQNIFSEDEYKAFCKRYEIEDGTNFEGKIHLLQKGDFECDELEDKLLDVRIKREQPFADRKLVSSWNSLAGIALVVASRAFEEPAYLDRAQLLFDELMDKHFEDCKIVHSSLDGKLQTEEFLEDYAALLLFTTYLHEERGGLESMMNQLEEKIDTFNDGDWIESHNDDFLMIRAERFDHPAPSSVGMTEMALLRKHILLDESYSEKAYMAPYSHDFINWSSLISNGLSNVVHAPERIDWKNLPVNTIRVRSKQLSLCKEQKCMIYNSKEELLSDLK
jgi:uncharacterized protein YyaL (SSP411 family)